MRYVVIVFVRLICLRVFIPNIISGIRRCSYVVSSISSHLLFNCDWSDLNSSMATYISIQDYIYLQHGFAWLIAVVMNFHFKQSAKSNLIFICIPFWIGFGRITQCWLAVCHSMLALHISPLRMHSSQHRWFDFTNTTSNNKDSANVEIPMRDCYAWR